MTRRRAFLTWSWGFTVLLLFLNTPRPRYAKDGKLFFYEQGFPFGYAHWTRDFSLVHFTPAEFAADAAVWVALLGLAWLCAWSRRERAYSGSGPNRNRVGKASPDATR